MIIDQQFIDDFVAQIRLGESTFNFSARLTPSTRITQKESSMFPLLTFLNNARINNTDVDDEAIAPYLVRVPADKQRKYALALKWIQKRLRGDNSHMFAALRVGGLSEKLSKSQQRFTIGLSEGDGGNGLCQQMALLWLKEQLSINVSSDFPRLADKNVIASKDAKKITELAIANRQLDNATITSAARLRLVADVKNGWNVSFDSFNEMAARNNTVRGFLISFWGTGKHAVAVYRQRNGQFQFYDANVGSYLIQANHLKTFLTTYNNTCLPLKWADYNLAATETFSSLAFISKA